MDTGNAPASAVKVTALASLAIAVAAGCSLGGHPVHDTAAVSDASSSAPNTKANPLPSKIANQPGVRKNVVQTTCAAVPGGWGAAGTATNPGTKPVTYKIVVYFTTTKATTLDYAQTLVPVKPGKTVPWKATKQFQAQKKMLCPMPGVSIAS